MRSKTRRSRSRMDFGPMIAPGYKPGNRGPESGDIASAQVDADQPTSESAASEDMWVARQSTADPVSGWSAISPTSCRGHDKLSRVNPLQCALLGPLPSNGKNSGTLPGPVKVESGWPQHRSVIDGAGSSVF